MSQSLQGENGVSMTPFEENFAKVPKNIDEEKLMYHVRAYVLYIIGLVVYLEKYATVPLTFLRLLRNDEFSRYSWGAALLAHFKEWYK
ncbi:hypothetical protein LguiB_012608 [Lonicera macranthoides]